MKTDTAVVYCFTSFDMQSLTSNFVVSHKYPVLQKNKETNPKTVNVPQLIFGNVNSAEQK